ncbi:MAG: exodeoxyribonuclease VII large subunit [Hafnia sp.]
MKLNEPLPLQVHISEKDAARVLGAKPHYQDGRFMYWFAPAGIDVMPFRSWWNHEFRKRMVEEGIVEDLIPEKPETDSLTLSAALGRVKKVVADGLKDPLWIRAEIVNISGSHHVYLELSDYDSKGEESAKAKAVIWGGDKYIISQFKESTGLDLKAGLKILFKGKFEFSERYGMSVRILSIDPAFTLGDMEAKIASIKKNLVQKGIFGANKELPMPFDFFKVVVISPDQAAGLGDFKTQADMLEAAGLCKFKYIPATFSGSDCTKSIVMALNMASRVFAGTRYDACVIIRGGGDKAGLYALNELEIVEAVCRFPAPVMVGIGHDRDNTLLDEVACIRCPTPSMVISHITSTIIKNADASKKNMLRMTKSSADVIAMARQKSEHLKHNFNKSVSMTISDARNSCERLHAKMDNVTKQYLVNTRAALKSMAERAYMNNPLTILQKGFTIVRNANGNVAASAHSIETNEIIKIQFRDGEINAMACTPINLSEGNDNV